MSENLVNQSSDFPKTKATEIGEYWQQEKEKLTAALAERILRSRDRIVFSELRESLVFLDMDSQGKWGETLLATLRHHARQLIRQEKPLVLQSKLRFALDDDEIRAQLRRLRDLLVDRLVFDKEELQAALAFGVHLQFDVITKPRAAIEDLIYPRSSARRKEDILVILQGFDDDFLPARHAAAEGKSGFIEQVQRLLDDYPAPAINKDGFSTLCRQAEREIYAMQPISALLADLQEYQSFCAQIGTANHQRIVYLTVLGMLYERGLFDVAEAVLPNLTQQQSWSIPELKLLLEQSTMPGALPFHPEASAVAPEVDLGDFLQQAANEIESQLVSAAVKDKQPPVGGQTTLAFPETELPAEGKENVVAEEAPEAVLQAPKTEIDAEPKPGTSEAAIEAPAEVSKIETDDDDSFPVEHAKIEAQPPGPYPSITNLFDEKNRRSFIKKIFQKDLEAYLAFVERLEGIQTWKEAKAFLDREFKNRNVHPYSKEAVRLSDLVFSRYFAKR